MTKADVHSVGHDPADLAGQPRLRAHLTGRFRLEAGGGMLDGAQLPGRQARLVLAVLLWDANPVPRDRLAEVLWGDSLPASWRRDLSALVSKLRTAMASIGLPADVITYDLGCYQFLRPAGTWVDTDTARAEVEAAEVATASGQPATARAAATVAAELARRPLLPGEDVAWLAAPRAELAEVLLRALELLADASAVDGDLTAAVRAATEAVALEPFRESGYVRLMRLHMAGGDAAEALRTYERCRRLLAEELGAAPSGELEDVYLAALGSARDHRDNRDHRRDRGHDQRDGNKTAELPPVLAFTKQAGTSMFFGRDTELRRAQECWAQARAGRCRMAVISGEPGAGKTRLAAELAAVVDRAGGAVLYGGCDEQGLIPYQPFVEALRAWAASAPTSVLETIDDGVLAELSRLLPELVRLLPGLTRPAPADPDTERYHLFEALRELLGTLAATNPVLLILDDLQWADQATQRLLRHLVRDPVTQPILLVAVTRDVPSAGQTFEPELGEVRQGAGWVVRVPVGDLGVTAVTEVITTMLGRDLTDQERGMARLLHRVTGGNPFFVTQLVRHGLETGTLPAFRDGEPQSGALPVEVPDTVKKAVRLRLARLSATTRNLLTVASVLEREFDLGVVGAVADLGDADLLDAVEEAVSAQVVAENRGVLDRYHFVHSVVRGVVYEDMTASRRARLHQRVGQVLETRWADQPDEHLAELAHHFAEAAELGEAERAFDYAVRAGRQADAQVAWEEAAGHYRRALRWLDLCGDTNEDRRCETLLRLGESLWRIGEVEQGKQVFRQAAALAVTGRADDLARATLGLGGPFVNFNVTVADDELIGLLERALAHPDLTDTRLRARLSVRLAEALTFVEPRERGVGLAHEAIALARRSGDGATLAYVLARCQWPLHDPDTLAERLAMAAESIELAATRQDRVAELEGHLWHIAAMAETGDLAAFDAELDEAMRLAGQLRQPYALWMLTSVEAMRAAVAGRDEQAERLAGQALEWGQRAQNDNAAMLYGSQMFTILAQRGGLDQIEPSVQAFIAEFPSLVVWRCGLVWLHAELGRLDDARAGLAQLAADGFAGVPRDPAWLLSISFLAETCVVVGDSARAQRLYHLLLPYADRWLTLVSVSFGSVARVLGRLATVLARWDDADRHFAGAVDAHRRAGADPWRARSQLDWAECLLRRGGTGDRERAAELVRNARGTGIAHRACRAAHAIAALTIVRQTFASRRGLPSPACWWCSPAGAARCCAAVTTTSWSPR